MNFLNSFKKSSFRTPINGAAKLYDDIIAKDKSESGAEKEKIRSSIDITLHKK